LLLCFKHSHQQYPVENQEETQENILLLNITPQLTI